MERTAIIFDLDGTLLDTLADIAEAANRVLALRQLPTHAVPAYRQLVGNGVEVLMQRALPPELSDPATVASASTEFRRVYSETWNHSTRPYADIPELLAVLADRHIPLAVLSNKPHANTLVCVNEFFADDTFAIVLGQRDEIPCKPDPTSAREIADSLGVSAARCWFVGDSDVDMQTAVRAGMQAIGATWGFRSRAELLRSGAQHAIDRPLELLSVLSRHMA